MRKFKLVVSKKFSKSNPVEKQLKELINGRKPVNESERKLVEQLEEMRAKGQIPYIPSDL